MSEPTPNSNFDGGHIGEPPAEPTPRGTRPTYPAAPADPYGGYSAPGTQAPTNQSAVLALIFGILSFVALGFIAAIPAVIFGNRAKRELAANGGEGATMATVGLVLGWVQLGLTAAAILLVIVIFVVSVVVGSH